MNSQDLTFVYHLCPKILTKSCSKHQCPEQLEAASDFCPNLWLSSIHDQLEWRSLQAPHWSKSTVGRLNYAPWLPIALTPFQGCTSPRGCLGVSTVVAYEDLGNIVFFAVSFSGMRGLPPSFRISCHLTSKPVNCVREAILSSAIGTEMCSETFVDKKILANDHWTHSPTPPSISRCVF